MVLLNNIGVGVIEDMKEWCEKVGIKNYTITNDFFTGRSMTTLENCPVEVGGEFNVWYSKIKDMKGYPNLMTSIFMVELEDLESLEGVGECEYTISMCECNKLKNLKEVKTHT